MLKIINFTGEEGSQHIQAKLAEHIEALVTVGDKTREIFPGCLLTITSANTAEYTENGETYVATFLRHKWVVRGLYFNTPFEAHQCKARIEAEENTYLHIQEVWV